MADDSLPIKHLERFAWLLDSAIRVPGTKFRIGLDPLIGLLPGIGDTIAAALSMYIIARAARAGLPRPVLLRMGVNVLLELVIGTIPVLGDLFDMGWKANIRNVRLLKNYTTASRATAFQSRIFLWLLGGALVFFALAAIFLGVWILHWLWLRLNG